MNRRLPALIPLRAFEAVGRTGSLRAAAEELCVSHSVISHHLHTLQQQLGVKLIRARGRGIELTSEGIMFQGEIARSFEIIAQATSDLLRMSGRTLKIWCRSGLAERRLLPHLPKLEALLPELEIVLCPTLARPTLGKGEADVEIAYLDQPEADPQLCAELLARPRVFPIASPSFLAGCPPIGSLESLSRLPLLHEDTTKHWERWLQAANVAFSGPLRGTRLWHAQLTIEAARLGHGIALSNDILVSADLDAGHLVEPVASDVWLGGYYILTESSRWLDRDIILVRQWLHGACMSGHQGRSPSAGGPASM
jgi:LysR family glycine cleavage system transcriptional activator